MGERHRRIGKGAADAGSVQVASGLKVRGIEVVVATALHRVSRVVVRAELVGEVVERIARGMAVDAHTADAEPYERHESDEQRGGDAEDVPVIRPPAHRPVMPGVPDCSRQARSTLLAKPLRHPPLNRLLLE